MIHDTELQKRLLDEIPQFAPTLDVLEMNERATAEWEECARRDPTGIEARGLEDILALRQKLLDLYRRNTLNDGHGLGK